MERDEKVQWDIIEKAKKVLLEWAKQNHVLITAVHFVPMPDLTLEVYIFYEKDHDIIQYQSNGVSDNIKRVFMDTLNEMKYFDAFSQNVTFIFDSNENVIKNYAGNYFFRLR